MNVANKVSKKSSFLQNPVVSPSLDEILGKTVQKLRKAAKLSQQNFAHMIGLHQASLSRVESGLQSLLPSQLAFLSEYFGIEIGSMLTGKVNLWKVSERFGFAPTLPDRYQKHLHSRVRETLPIVGLLNETIGEYKTQEILHHLELDNLLYLSPDHLISANCNLDLIRHSIEHKFLKPNNLSSLVRQSLKSEAHGVLDSIYHSQTTPIHALQARVLSSRLYEENFNYELTNIRENATTLVITPQKHMEEIPYNDEVLRNFLCRYKKKMFSLFPTYINLPPLTLNERECLFKGQNQCIYELSV